MPFPWGKPRCMRTVVRVRSSSLETNTLPVSRDPSKRVKFKLAIDAESVPKILTNDRLRKPSLPSVSP
jgi:hypothetical protein